jgi:hypothetical protein
VAALAALPALAGGLVPWAGERARPPFAVRVPDATSPASGGPAARPADQAAPAAPTGRPAGDDQQTLDDHDEDDADSSGPGPGGDGSGGGGSSGPG